MNDKTCKKCLETKPMTEFYRNRQARDGRQSRCKKCQCAYNAQWRTANPEYLAQWRTANPEYDARWRAANAEKIRESQTRWRAENTEKLRAYQTQWRSENSEKLRAYQAQWRAENPEKVREYEVKWRSENPVSYRDGTIRRQGERRARKAGNPVEQGINASALLESQGGMCYLCLEHIDLSLQYPHPASLSVDHVLPISKGGGHTWDNTRACHLGCNFAKGSKPLDTLSAPVDVEVAA